MIVSLDCLFVLYLMARGDCVSGLSVCSVSYGQRWLCVWIVCLFCILWPEVGQTDNPETQSPLAIRYRTNRQSRDTITSGHKIQNKQTIQTHNHRLFVRFLMARGDCVSGLSVCSVSYGQRWLCLWIVYLFCILWSGMIGSLDCLFVLYLMARGDCGQSRDTITSGHKIQSKQKIQRRNHLWP
jgi:hypothetical protein